MVRKVVGNRRLAVTAVLAIVVGGVAVVWHLLACVESPMSFSPNGKSLAFVTMEPYSGDEDVMLAGKHVYRLMVLTEGKPLRVLEETSQEMLSGPAFSSDGKYLCYFRIPLSSEAELARLKEHTEKWDKWHSEKPDFEWGRAPGSVPATQSIPDDTALPSFEELFDWEEAVEKTPPLPGRLVERDAETGEVVSNTPVYVPPVGEPKQLIMTYVLAHPQYAPHGRRVYGCAGSLAYAIDPTTSETRMLAPAALGSALSPDGKLLAVLQQKALAIVETSGERACYRRLNEYMSPAGFAWVDAKTLMALEMSKDYKQAQLRWFGPEASLLKSAKVSLPPRKEHEEGNFAMAVSPNGQQIVLAFMDETFFLKADGSIVKHWQSEKDHLAQPTFSPDGQRVAFKVMEEEQGQEPSRASAIAFFSPAGEELSRVPIPAATVPASQPAGGR